MFSFCQAKKLPYMPVYSPLTANKIIGDLVLPVSQAFPAVPSTLSYAHLWELLNRCSKRWARLPVVTPRDGHLVGTIAWNTLRDIIRTREREFDVYLEETLLPPYIEASLPVDIEALVEARAVFFEKMIEIPAAQIDFSPLQMGTKTPLSKAHFIFSMLSPSAVYVTESGVLMGVVTKEMLIAFISANS